MDLAPIIFFAYKRPVHTEQALESLMANPLARHSQLHVYLDGPSAGAPQDELDAIREVRLLVARKAWCGHVEVTASERNRGLADFLPGVMGEWLERHESVIVLEDDLILSKGLLRYMNDALQAYATEPRVMHVSGYAFPARRSLPDTYFLRFTTSWGWATWRRAWAKFQPSGKRLLQALQDRPDFESFRIPGTPDMLRLLLNCVEGIKNHWDVRWYASVFLEGGLGLFPGRSMTRNTGHDGSGQHCRRSFMTDTYHRQELRESTSVYPIPIEEHRQGRLALEQFMRSAANPGFLVRVREKVKYELRRLGW